MKLLEKIQQLERVHLLVKRGGTGTPRQLASKIGVSERTIFRLLNELKNIGLTMYYNKYRQSYCYDKSKVELNLFK